MNFIDTVAVIIFCMSSIHAKPPEINLYNNTKEIAKSVACKPRKVFVEILPDTTKIQPQISGRVIQVKRCMGFDGRTRCVPIKSVNIKIKVQLVDTKESQIFLVPQHTRCKSEEVQPKVKPQTCPEGKKWNKTKSRCECDLPCTSGSFLDKKSCRCVIRSSESIT